MKARLSAFFCLLPHLPHPFGFQWPKLRNFRSKHRLCWPGAMLGSPSCLVVPWNSLECFMVEQQLCTLNPLDTIPWTDRRDKSDHSETTRVGDPHSSSHSHTDSATAAMRRENGTSYSMIKDPGRPELTPSGQLWNPVQRLQQVGSFLDYGDLFGFISAPSSPSLCKTVPGDDIRFNFFLKGGMWAWGWRAQNFYSDPSLPLSS